MPNIYEHLIGYVSERDIRGTRVYCIQERGVFYVTYNSAAVSPPIVSAATEEEAYQKWEALGRRH